MKVCLNYWCRRKHSQWLEDMHTTCLYKRQNNDDWEHEDNDVSTTTKHLQNHTAQTQGYDPTKSVFSIHSFLGQTNETLSQTQHTEATVYPFRSSMRSWCKSPARCSSTSHRPCFHRSAPITSHGKVGGMATNPQVVPVYATYTNMCKKTSPWLVCTPHAQ